MAALFFMASALLGPLARFSRGDASAAPLTAEWGALSFGLVALLLPWDRWPQRRLHVVAAAGFALKVVTTLEIGASPWLYTLHYVMLFMWIGAALGPRTSLLWALPAAAAYVGPILVLEGDRAAIASAILVIPASVFTGEAAAWLTTHLRRAERTSQTRAEAMARLVDATLTIAASQERDDLARLTARSAVEIYGADCALVVLDGGKERLTPAGMVAWKEHSLSALEDPSVAELLRRAMGSDEVVPSADVDHLARAFGLAHVRLLPLCGSSAARGLALVGSFAPAAPDAQFTEYVARTLATQAGLGFERVQSAQTLRAESLRDPLTELGNRRSAEAQLERLKHGDVVAVIDLDHFKGVNDTYGHAAGDRALCALADHLRCSVRGPDSAYRIGGEEFLVVLPGAHRSGLGIVRRLHQRWRAQDRVTTFSAGVAIVASGESAHAAVARADGALYQAKREGRDRVALDAGPDDQGA